MLLWQPLLPPTYFKPHFCADRNSYFADGGLVSNNPSFVGLREIFSDMGSDFPNAQIKNIKILNVGTLSENFCISPKVLKKNSIRAILDYGEWEKGLS